MFHCRNISYSEESNRILLLTKIKQNELGGINLTHNTEWEVLRKESVNLKLSKR